MKTPPQKRKLQNEIQLARGRLRGALNEQTQQTASDDEEPSPSAGLAINELPHRGRPPKNLAALQQQSPRSSRHLLQQSPGKYLSPSRRRKRAEAAAAMQSQKIQAESFVMKLFDRSLDLSKYTEQTSLYPICRAWMVNQPRNPSIRSYTHDNRSPSPAEREENAAEVLVKMRRGEVREIRVMPAPAETDLMNFPRFDGADTKPGDEKDMERLHNANRDELLASHKNKWKKIKSDWVKHTKGYQRQRYDLNYQIIQELFKP